VWLTEVDAVGNTTTHWTRVDNIAYNSPKNDRNVFQVETLENDNIQLVFGDGNYSNVPSGSFVLWARSSESLSASIPVSAIQKRTVLFEYQDLYGNRQTCTIVFSLTTPIENQAEPESIQKIQQAVPGVYYTQDRMVNAQDHEGYLLQDSQDSPNILVGMIAQKCMRMSRFLVMMVCCTSNPQLRFAKFSTPTTAYLYRLLCLRM
jgi:hypothetical protein